jgi:hypothetical protein
MNRLLKANWYNIVFPVRELSPNSLGLYAKIVAFLTMVFAGADRFSHLACLGNKEVIARIFGVQRLPDAATTLTRLFGKMKKLPSADALSDGLWQYLSRLIPWRTMKADWLKLRFNGSLTLLNAPKGCVSLPRSLLVCPELSGPSGR